jgi:hypothetical protein
LADSIERGTIGAAQERPTVVELMTENDPEHGSDGTGGHEAENSADRLTEPLHRSSARIDQPAHAREVAERRCTGSLSRLSVFMQRDERARRTPRVESA